MFKQKEKKDSLLKENILSAKPNMYTLYRILHK